MSRSYRFHGPAADPDSLTPIRLHKRRRGGRSPFVLVGADKASITYDAGTIPLDAFREVLGDRGAVLTRREADLIALANPGARPPAALEDVQPWLPDRFFLSDSAASYRSLALLMQRYGDHLVDASGFCDEKWNTICNAARMKNDLDS